MKIWTNAYGQPHRVGGPAMEYDDGLKTWWVSGRRHRIDGPAVEGIDDYKEWWYDDINYSFDEWLSLTDKSDEEKVLLKLRYG